MELSVHLQNIQHGAVDKSGDRWPLLAERLGHAKPDVVLINEALGWGNDGEYLLKRAESDLGMTALRPLPSARSGHHVVILYRPGTIGEPASYNTDFSDQFEHGVGVGVWAVPGLPRPLSVTVTHLSPFSNADAFAEAEKTRWTALRHDKTDEPYAIIGADWNAAPLFGPAPELSRMYTRDRVTRSGTARAPSPTPTSRNTSTAQGSMTPARSCTTSPRTSGTWPAPDAATASTGSSSPRRCDPPSPAAGR